MATNKEPKVNEEEAVPAEGANGARSTNANGEGATGAEAKTEEQKVEEARKAVNIGTATDEQKAAVKKADEEIAKNGGEKSDNVAVSPGRVA